MSTFARPYVKVTLLFTVRVQRLQFFDNVINKQPAPYRIINALHLKCTLVCSYIPLCDLFHTLVFIVFGTMQPVFGIFRIQFIIVVTSVGTTFYDNNAFFSRTHTHTPVRRLLSWIRSRENWFTDTIIIADLFRSSHRTLNVENTVSELDRWYESPPGINPENVRRDKLCGYNYNKLNKINYLSELKNAL